MSDENLIKAAANLSHYPEWQAFIVAMDAHVAQVRDECILAAPEQLVKNQGRAQVLSQLFLKLLNCRLEAEKLSKRK